MIVTFYYTCTHMINSTKTKNTKKQNSTAALQSIDYNITATVDSAGTVWKIPQPVYGTAPNNRIGDRIKYVKFDLNLFFLSSAETQFRFIILQTIGFVSTLATSAVLSAGVSTTVDITSMFRPGIIGRYCHVLVDEAFVMIPQASNAQRSMRLSLRLPVSNISFEPGGNDVFSGQLYVIAISDSALAPHPGIEMATRLWFDA